MKRTHRWAVLALFLFVAAGSGCTTLKRWQYEGCGRDDWQQTDEVIRALNVKPGERVADLGAGTGYFTFPLARAVGPSGAVYAIDIDPDMTTYVHEHAEQQGIAQIHTILATPQDPRLPADGVDLVFISNTYHHIDDRPAYFGRVKPHLRPGGRIAIVDFDGRGFVTWITGHTSAPGMVRSEMTAAGYELQHEYAFLNMQSFLVFTAKAD